MKYNKGFAPLILLAIIVGALVVGGGAVYFATKTPTSPKNIEENNYQPQENQNSLETTNNNQEVKKAETNPSIEIFSPKEGEELVIGSKYTINYKTNSIPKDAIVFLFVGSGEKNKWMKIVPSDKLDSFSATSSSYTWIVPKEICGVEICTSLISGQKYKFEAILTGTINNQFQDIVTDVSDNFFTVVSNPKESVITKNDVINQPAYLKSVYIKNGKNYIDVDYIQMFATIEEQKKAATEDGFCDNIATCDVYNNGYKRNTNPLIRTFEVSSSVIINVYGEYNQYLNNGDLNSANSLINFSQLKEYKQKSGNYEQYIVLDVKDNKVIKIIEPYQE